MSDDEIVSRTCMLCQQEFLGKLPDPNVPSEKWAIYENQQFQVGTHCQKCGEFLCKPCLSEIIDKAPILKKFSVPCPNCGEVYRGGIWLFKPEVDIPTVMATVSQKMGAFLKDQAKDLVKGVTSGTQETSSGAGFEIPKLAPVVDLWPNSCSQCGIETSSPVEFVVYTALMDNRRTGGSGAVREYTTTYSGFQEHHCRVCDRCRESYKQRSRFMLIVPLALLGGGLILQMISRITQGKIDLDFKNVCGLGFILIVIEVAAFFLKEYLFTPKNKAKNKAEKLREAGGGWIKGLTVAEYEGLKGKNG